MMLKMNYVNHVTIHVKHVCNMEKINVKAVIQINTELLLLQLDHVYAWIIIMMKMLLSYVKYVITHVKLAMNGA